MKIRGALVLAVVATLAVIAVVAVTASAQNPMGTPMPMEIPDDMAVATDEPYAGGDGPYDGGGGGQYAGDESWESDYLRPAVWVRADYLHWWTKGSHNPPLVTTSIPSAAQVDAGVLGRQRTVTLFGNDEVDDEDRPGGRIAIGTWLDSCRLWGLEGEYFEVDTADTDFSVSSATYPILARPFFNVMTAMQASSIVAYPASETGTASVETSSSLVGGGLTVRRALVCNWPFRLDLLAGYRYVQMDDGLQIREASTVVAAGGFVPQGTTIDVLDEFTTRNTFHGGDIGLAAQWDLPTGAVHMMAKVALGNNEQQVAINGGTVFQLPGMAPDPRVGGILALPSNIGSYTREEFTYIPEVRFRLDHFVNSQFKVHVGYTFMYVGDVVRPGDQIDLNVDTDQIPPPVPGNMATQPAFVFRTTDYWAQGLDVGGTIRF